MAIRNVRRPVKPGTPSGSGDGRVYAGGSPYFNEATGTYRPGTPKDILDRVRGRKGDRPDMGINPPRPPRGRKPKPGDDGRRTIMPVPPRGGRRRPMIDPEDRGRKLPVRGKISNGKRRTR